MPSRGRRWDVVRRLALDRDGWRCVLCGRAGRLEVDHIKPLKDGGDMWDLANLQSLCRPCHFQKTASENGIPRLRPETLAWQALVDAGTVSL